MIGLDMKHFPSFESDLKMMEKLVSEESVFALPGQCFDYPNYMRLVLTLPKELTIQACDRISSFCNRHYVECESQLRNGINNNNGGSLFTKPMSDSLRKGKESSGNMENGNFHAVKT